MPARTSLLRAQIVAMTALVGCGCDGTFASGGGYPREDLRVGGALDLLFVIENAGSIFERQPALADAFPVLLAALLGPDGELPSLHIGVLSTSPGTPGFTAGACRPDGDDGRLQSAPRGERCAGPAGAFIADERSADGGRRRNYEGRLADVFRCIAVLGTGGCAFEQPLESLRLALDGHQEANAGFLRPDARLLVVFFAEEDDCSAVDPSAFLGAATGPEASSFRCTEHGVTCASGESPRRVGSYDDCRPAESGPLHHPRRYLDFIRGLKADPGMIMAAGIVGPPSPFLVTRDFDGSGPRLGPSCSGVAGQAWPAVRLAWFIEQLGGGARLFPNCTWDLTAALSRVGADARRLIDSACLHARAADTDVDPAARGRQLDCAVTDTASGRAVPACPMDDQRTPAPGGPRPCWWADRQPDICGHRPHELALHVEDTAPANVTARCRARDR